MERVLDRDGLAYKGTILPAARSHVAAQADRFDLRAGGLPAIGVAGAQGPAALTLELTGA